MSALSLEDALLTACAEALGNRPVEVEFRREMGAYADAVIALRDPSEPTGADRARLERALIALPFVENTRVGRRSVNLRLREAVLAQALEDLAVGVMPTPGRRRAGESWIVDFADPNLTKPLHVGHLRSLALGSAAANLLKTAGASVTTQAVVCDIGRNVAEALAGCRQAGAFAVESPQEVKSDQLVGRCYADYVQAAQLATQGAEADAPVQRELHRHGDEADRLLDAWREGDAEVIWQWRRLLDWVSTGQAVTLRRLGIRLDRTISEANALPSAEVIAAHGLEAGIFARLPDGALGFDTGRSAYPRMMLTRTDGFPTEHLRGLAVWLSLGEEVSACEGVLHVMGDEWLISTEERVRLLARFQDDGRWRSYRTQPHAMVRFGGSLLKSSAGGAWLVDDLLDALEADYSGQPDRARWAALAALGMFLNAPARDPLDLQDVSQRLAGREVADALILLEAPSGEPVVDREVRRFAALQGARLSAVLRRSFNSLDPVPVFRFLLRSARAARACAHDPLAAAAIRRMLEAGLATLGLGPEGRSPA